MKKTFLIISTCLIMSAVYVTSGSLTIDGIKQVIATALDPLGDYIVATLTTTGTITSGGNISIPAAYVMYFEGQGSDSFITRQTGGGGLMIMRADGVTAQGWDNTYTRIYDNIQFRLGNSDNYWHIYNTATSNYTFNTTDGDGAGTDMDIFSVSNGTVDVNFEGKVKTLTSMTSDTDPTVTLTLADKDTYGTIRWNTDNDVIAYTLPAASDGQVISFANFKVAQVITVDCAATDAIILNDGTELGSAVAAVSSGAVDDKGTFVGKGTNWVIFSEQNAWASE